MIFKGEIAMKLGFDIEIYNDKYNEKIISDKISDVLDDAMGVFLDDTCIMMIVKETLSDALETRAAVKNVALKTHKVFNRSDDLFLKCEAEFDYVGHKNVENMDLSDTLKEVVLDIARGENSFFDEMYLYESSEGAEDFEVNVYVIEDSIYSKAEIVRE